MLLFYMYTPLSMALISYFIAETLISYTFKTQMCEQAGIAAMVPSKPFFYIYIII